MRTPLVWLMAASFVFGGAARQDIRTPATPNPNGRRRAASPKPGPADAGGGGPLAPALAPETANLIGTYCVSCHNDRAKTGGLSLQTLSITNLPEHGDVWEKVARKLRSGEMPPSTVRSRPDAKQAEAFAVFVETTLDRAAAARPNPGRAPVHRLNRAEYSNAVRDLLAVDVRPGEWLPVDDSGYGFDNIAAVLSTSPALLDKLHVGGAQGQPPGRWRSHAETGRRDLRREARSNKGPRNEQLNDDLPFDSRAGMTVEHARGSPSIATSAPSSTGTSRRIGWWRYSARWPD